MTNLLGANLNNGAAIGPQGEGRESTSSFPTYPAYKDSGVEWLGEVPEHWGVSPLKWLAEQVTDKATTSSFQVGLENIEGWTGRFIETDTEFSGDGIAFRQEDILFGKLRPYLAKVWLADKSGQAVGDFFVLRPRAVNSEFLHKYILTPTVIADLNASTIGAKMPRVGWEDMAALAVTLPPHKEQTQIARFLDYETARIDALIEEQQRLIELLKEKRQAVISHAVTKGLDPTVPMKDSGVEWLGEVPAHWDVIRSKFAFSLVSGYAFKSEFFQKNGEGEKVLITPGSFDELGRLYFSEKSTVRYEGEWQAQFELKFGDLVMVLTDLSYKKLILGRAAFVERDDALLNQRIAKVVITPRVEANYLWLGINSEVMREQLKLTASGATVFHTSPEKVGDCWMALPPCEEQLKITAFVEEFHLKLDTLIQQVINTVGLLAERRSALISAAVTGKIDVRNW